MSQKKLLIVDDNRDLADGLAMILEDEGYRVTLAYNGADGITAFNNERFHVVLLDVKLPDMNGIEVFQKIHKKDPAVRVIMMTGYRVEQLLAEVIGDGEVKILRKPIEMERVSEILAQIQKESIILLADNDADLATKLSAYLTAQGKTNLLARDGQQAVDDVVANPVEVLVLDLGMPIMCSLEVYLELKQRDCSVKTIIVTGYAHEASESIDLLRSTAATGCLFKPFKPAEMLHAIEQAIAH